jgi:hypothetical protein
MDKIAFLRTAGYESHRQENCATAHWAADEIERLTELLRSEGANRYWEGRWRDEFAENTRLRELLRGVVREADRETNAFIAARAALAEQRG